MYGIELKEYPQVTLIPNAVRNKLAKEFARQNPQAIIDPETAMIETNDKCTYWGFNFHFNMENWEAIKTFFKRYDPYGDYSPSEEINKYGWGLLPESMSIAILLAMDLVDYPIDKILMFHDGLLLLPESHESVI